MLFQSWWVYIYIYIFFNSLWTFLPIEFIVIHNGIVTNYKDLRKFLVNLCVLNYLQLMSFLPLTDEIKSLSISIGEQRLWVWIRDWYRVHCQVGEVHVWQQGERWHQLCYTSGACYPAAGMDLLMRSDTCGIIRRWVEPVCLIPTFQEGAFALVFKSVHYPGEAVGTR